MHEGNRSLHENVKEAITALQAKGDWNLQNWNIFSPSFRSPPNSSPSFSTPPTSSVIFQSCNFQSCKFSYPESGTKNTNSRLKNAAKTIDLWTLRAVTFHARKAAFIIDEKVLIDENRIGISSHKRTYIMTKLTVAWMSRPMQTLALLHIERDLSNWIARRHLCASVCRQRNDWTFTGPRACNRLPAAAHNLMSTSKFARCMKHLSHETVIAMFVCWVECYIYTKTSTCAYIGHKTGTCSVKSIFQQKHDDSLCVCVIRYDGLYINVHPKADE